MLPIDFGPTRADKRMVFIHRQYNFREPGPTHLGFGYLYRSGWPFIAVPYWAMILAFAIPGPALWLRKLPWRFSLRSVLIATTLVAVVLGFIVCMTRR
jgi:hypothetical protein